MLTVNFEELGKLIKQSWDKFTSETPKDLKWLVAFDAYMEENKQLYSDWNHLRKLKDKGSK